jgi:SpoVK/Ycf46/Vps4 family AAA+-type ATPase
MNKSSLRQWQIQREGIYTACNATVKKLPSAVYQLKKTSHTEEFYLKMQNVITDGLIDLPVPESIGIINDIRKFWSMEEEYRNANMIHKRGILLYGSPGSGKSTLINKLVQTANATDAVTINITCCEEIEYYIAWAPEMFRIIEPDRKLLVILEEIDGLLWRGHIDIPTILLNMLDGLNQVNKVVYVATTNHITKLDGAFTNRPGRFDIKSKVGLPNKETRRYFIEHKLTAEQLKNVNLNQWVDESEGLSIAHLRELIISVLIMGHDYNKTIESLKKMKEFISDREESGVREIGF